jgi:uncharacterized repeat protein (TIGR03803 family)
MKPFSAFRNVSLWAAILQIVATITVEAQTNYQRVKSFGLPDTGTQPHSALLLARDGVLYGTTQMGGSANQGTVFRLNVDGSGYAVLHAFSTNCDGKNPVGALIQGQDGALYGSTVYGGSNRCGTVFTLTTNGSGYAVLHHFDKTILDGQYPYGRLVQDAGGILYGTTSFSTNNGPGTIYKLNTNGSGFALIHAFAANGAEGQNPVGLILGQDGELYGTSHKGSATSGVVFKLNVDGTGFTVWTSIPTNGLRAHMNALCQGTNGVLYGTTCYNTTAEKIFSIGTNGSNYIVLYTFPAKGTNGQNPDTQLLQGLDGAFYGTTVAGGTNGAGTLFKINGDGTGFMVLYHFKTNNADGRWPEDALIQGPDGTLYGTTLRGGFSDDGTVYSIHPDGSGYTQLHQFNSFASEGRTPSGSLTPDGAGSLYGVTHCGGNGGYGTLFMIGLDGKNYSIVRHFGGSSDGQWPSGQLLLGPDAAWYGTTYTGGSNNFGTVFKIRGDGTGYTQLHSFFGTNDGDVPCDALVLDAAGMLYGTTAAGGSNSVGTVFTLSTNGTGFAVLHTFVTNGVDGASPAGGLLLGNDGTLYGLTEAGGTNNAGSVFELNTTGNDYALLHNFQTNGADGTAPGSGLLQGANGALYGTTQQGGTNGAGTVFSINPDGSGYGIVQSFSSSLTNSLTFRRGAGALVQASGSTLYGTIYEGGVSNSYGGLMFQINTDGSGYNTVHGFGTNTGDGLNPSGGMVFAGASWYGTTEFGGDWGAGSLYSLAVVAPGISAQPQDQTARAGIPVLFNVVANGSPADYQWYFNGTALTNATGLDLLLAAVARTNAGTYFLTVSNVAGTVVSCNALLTVRVPMIISTPQSLSNGSWQIASAYADGWPLTPDDLVRFNVQVSSNLTDWVSLNDALTVSNGMMLLNDSTATSQPARFYRVLEWP